MNVLAAEPIFRIKERSLEPANLGRRERVSWAGKRALQLRERSTWSGEVLVKGWTIWPPATLFTRMVR